MYLCPLPTLHAVFLSEEKSSEETRSSVVIASANIGYEQCYLCPNNKRAQGDSNPNYANTFIFVNDYSAVKEIQDEYVPEGNPAGVFFFLPALQPF